MNVLSIQSLFKTLREMNIITKTQKELIGEMMQYELADDDEMQELIKENIEVLQNMNSAIKKSKINEELKTTVSLIITYFLKYDLDSKYNSSLLSQISNKIAQYQEYITKLEKEYQTERDEHNELRRKYNEETKAETIELPKIQALSITTKKNKSLSTREMIDLSKQIKGNTFLKDRFSRISIKDVEHNLKDKVSTVYAKAAETTTITQKEAKK